MITHTTAFVTPVVEHRLEREIAQWGCGHIFEFIDYGVGYIILSTQHVVSFCFVF